MKSILNFSVKSILIATLFFLSGCTDFDDNLKTAPVANPADVITKDSELYTMIEKVVTPSETNPLDEIVCIDFIYPVNLLIYDQNLNIIGSQVIISDDQFSAFLGALPAQQSLSISYPISTTLQNGDVFNVNNNSELKLAIDSCSREDIVIYCNNLFCNSGGPSLTPCVWKVQYGDTHNNKYVGGTFLPNVDGSLVFNYDQVDYTGTWNFEFVNSELHININLQGTSAVALDWNIDSPAGLFGDTIIIRSPPKSTVLNHECEAGTEYHIGEVGPSNGIVFYDKGSYSNGWRYMEAAPNDLGFWEWGCAGSSIASAQHTAIGRGLYNTAAIVNFHDALNNYYGNPSVCNSSNNGTVAAQKGIQLQSGSFNGWFLPSTSELNLMYANLYLQGIGNLSVATYWTSTEIDSANAQTINFATGDLMSTPKIPPVNTIRARAVRYF